MLSSKQRKFKQHFVCVVCGKIMPWYYAWQCQQRLSFLPRSMHEHSRVKQSFCPLPAITCMYILYQGWQAVGGPLFYMLFFCILQVVSTITTNRDLCQAWLCRYQGCEKSITVHKNPRGGMHIRWLRMLRYYRLLAADKECRRGQDGELRWWGTTGSTHGPNSGSRQWKFPSRLFCFIWWRLPACSCTLSLPPFVPPFLTPMQIKVFYGVKDTKEIITLAATFKGTHSTSTLPYFYIVLCMEFVNELYYRDSALWNTLYTRRFEDVQVQVSSGPEALVIVWWERTKVQGMV